MGSTLFRDPQALTSTLTSLRMLQPQAFRSLNRVDPLDSVSNYYLEGEEHGDFPPLRLTSPSLILFQLLSTQI